MMDRYRLIVLGVGIALLAVFTAQTCASAAKSPLGMVYDIKNAPQIIPESSDEQPVREPATTSPPREGEIEVKEKVTVTIDGPLFGRRDIEEEISKWYKLAPPPVRFVPTVVYPPPMQYHNPVPVFHQPMYQQPMFRAPPMQMNFAPPMYSGGGFAGGGIANCGPSG